MTQFQTNADDRAGNVGTPWDCPITRCVKRTLNVEDVRCSFWDVIVNDVCYTLPHICLDFQHALWRQEFPEDIEFELPIE